LRTIRLFPSNWKLRLVNRIFKGSAQTMYLIKEKDERIYKSFAVFHFAKKNRFLIKLYILRILCSSFSPRKFNFVHRIFIGFTQILYLIKGKDKRIYKYFVVISPKKKKLFFIRTLNCGEHCHIENLGVEPNFRRICTNNVFNKRKDKMI
jgi:hypothetical protein